MIFRPLVLWLLACSLLTCFDRIGLPNGLPGLQFIFRNGKRFSHWLQYRTFLQRSLCFSYRDLLDSWRLWTQRAHFDIALNAPNDAERPSQQIFVSCNFCGKSISAFMQGRNRGILARLGTTANKLKVKKKKEKKLPCCSLTNHTFKDSKISSAWFSCVKLYYWLHSTRNSLQHQRGADVSTLLDAQLSLK